MDPSSLKVLAGDHISPTMALKYCIDEEISKLTSGESSNIDGRLFVPRHSNKQEYVLGPIFREVPAQLPALYPRLEDHFLLYEGRLDWGTWRVNRPHRCWPTLRTEWEEWYDRVVPAREDDLQELYILDALRLSRFIIPEDPFLIPAALCFWNMAFNFFQFRCGMMAPTVLDICHLLGLSPHGSPFTPNYPDLPVKFSLPALSSSYSDFVKAENKREGPVRDREFFSFILYWLCKFLFCTSSQRIMPEFAPLAKALVLKKHIALAPYLLGHVYRTCSQFCEKPLDANQGGPLWVLQLWLFAYFTDLHPKCLGFLVQDPSTYGEKYARIALYPASFAYYFTFFYQLPISPSASFFCPFEANRGPTWLQSFLADKECSTSPHKDMWASILLPRELFIGTLNPRAYKCISEVYCPSQFARQFGLSQGIPVPLCSLSNVHLTARDLRIPKSKPEAAVLRLLKELSEFQFIPFRPFGSVLKRFKNWWTANMEVRLSAHPHDLLVGLGLPSKDKSTTAQNTSPPPEVVTTTPATLPLPARVTRAASKKGEYLQVLLLPFYF